jgi:hypothetical protein
MAALLGDTFECEPLMGSGGPGVPVCGVGLMGSGGSGPVGGVGAEAGAYTRSL